MNLKLTRRRRQPPLERAGAARSHILIIGLNYEPETTGIAPYTTGLARYLAGQRYEVTVVTGHPHYPQWRLHPGFETPVPPQWDRGVEVIRVPHPVPKNPTGASRIWMEIVFAWRVSKHLLRYRPTVVVGVSPALISLVPPVLLRRQLDFRLGVLVQDMYGAAVAEAGLSGLSGVAGKAVARCVARLEASLLRRTDGVAAIHEVFRRRLIAEGVAPEKISVIPNWSHVTITENRDRATVRKRLGWDENEFVALHAGNMGAKQALEGLVDVARLAERRGSKVRIILMGNGSRRSALHDYSRDLRRDIIMDSLPPGDFEAALVAADCLLLHEKPGVLEMSVPSKLTTYFTAGRPVVAATDPLSGAARLMTDAQAGPVVPAGDAQLILDEIEGLARDDAVQRRYGQNGRHYAAEKLGRLAALERYEAWIWTLLSTD